MGHKAEQILKPWRALLWAPSMVVNISITEEETKPIVSEGKPSPNSPHPFTTWIVAASPVNPMGSAIVPSLPGDPRGARTVRNLQGNKLKKTL